MKNIPIDIRLENDIRNLPEVPSIEVLQLLSCSCYALVDIRRIGDRGKVLQREHGLECIPSVAEIEWAAGFWDLIRCAVIEERRKQREGVE